MQTSTARVRDMVLNRADGPYCLTTSLSMVAELLEGRVDAVAGNEVQWGPGGHWSTPCRTSQS
jgi:hypothetical protein